LLTPTQPQEAELCRTYSSLLADEAGVPIEIMKEVLAKEGRDVTAKPKVLSAAQRIMNSRLSKRGAQHLLVPKEEHLLVPKQERVSRKSFRKPAAVPVSTDIWDAHLGPAGKQLVERAVSDKWEHKQQLTATREQMLIDPTVLPAGARTSRPSYHTFVPPIEVDAQRTGPTVWQQGLPKSSQPSGPVKKAVPLAVRLSEKLVDMGANGAINLRDCLTELGFKEPHGPQDIYGAGILIDELCHTLRLHGLQKEEIELSVAWKLGFTKPGGIQMPPRQRLMTPPILPGSNRASLVHVQRPSTTYKNNALPMPHSVPRTTTARKVIRASVVHPVQARTAASFHQGFWPGGSARLKNDLLHAPLPPCLQQGRLSRYTECDNISDHPTKSESSAGEPLPPVNMRMLHAQRKLESKYAAPTHLHEGSQLSPQPPDIPKCTQTYPAIKGGMKNGAHFAHPEQGSLSFREVQDEVMNVMKPHFGQEQAAFPTRRRWGGVNRPSLGSKIIEMQSKGIVDHALVPDEPNCTKHPAKPLTARTFNDFSRFRRYTL